MESRNHLKNGAILEKPNFQIFNSNFFMKKNWFTLGRTMAMTALAFSVIATGCKDDEDTSGTPAPTPKKNEVKIDGTTTAVNSATIIYYGDWLGKGTQNFDILISTGDLSIDLASQSITGIGDVVYGEFFTNVATHLANGDYNFMGDTTKYGDAFTFTYGDFTKNFDFANQTTEYESDITGGKLNVVHTAGAAGAQPTYELTFNYTLANGKQVTGYYKGQLAFIDDSRTARTEQTKKLGLQIREMAGL